MEISEFFEIHSEVAVAFSGGVDSAVLLALAKKHAKKVKAYCVKSQFQPVFELDDAKEIAAENGVALEIIYVDVLADKAVAKNTENRCYLCKMKIFSEIISAARKDGFDTVVDGTNASDDISDRPGFKALGELVVLSPLRLCGLKKQDVRKIAREYGIPVADKPSYSCLATRIPFGTPITKELLEKTESAEKELMDMGFRNFRVRYNCGGARLELGKAEHKLYEEKRERADNAILKYYDDITLDLKERADE